MLSCLVFVAEGRQMSDEVSSSFTGTRVLFPLSLTGRCFSTIALFGPPLLRSLVLEYLHSDHLGMRKMKSLVRIASWWPEIDGSLW